MIFFRHILLVIVFGLDLSFVHLDESRAEENLPPAKRESPVRNDRYGDPLPPGAVDRLGTVRFRHSANVFDLAYAPDGKTLAAVDHDGISLWDVETGKELRRLDMSTTGSFGLAFAPDGKSLVTATGGGFVYWNLATGRQHARLPLEEPAGSLTLSPDSKTIAWTTFSSKQFRLSEAGTGKVLHRWNVTGNLWYQSAAFSPDSQMLAFVCGDEKEIPLFDTVTGKQVRRLIGHEASVNSVVFSPDGRAVVSSAQDSTLSFWDPATGNEVRKVKSAGVAGRLVFSPDGRLLATGSTTVHLWDATTGKLLRGCEPDLEDSVEHLAFSPDSKSLSASRVHSHAISFWDVATGKKRESEVGHIGRVNATIVSPDGKFIASAAWEKTVNPRNSIKLWDSVTRKSLGTIGADLGGIECLALSPDGRILAAGDAEGNVRLWDPASRRELRRLPGNKDHIEWISFAADGKTLASLSFRSRGTYHDRTVRLWDVSAGKELRHFSAALSAPANGIALAPDGKTMAQGWCFKSTLALWDTATGAVVKQFGNSGVIWGLAISPDGRILASGGSDEVTLWDLASGLQLRKITDSCNWGGLLTFSSDGRTLVCGGDDHIIRFLEVASGKVRRRFEGHRGAIRCGAFSVDGRQFFSGSDDTTILIWDVVGQTAVERPKLQKLGAGQLE